MADPAEQVPPIRLADDQGMESPEALLDNLGLPHSEILVQLFRFKTDMNRYAYLGEVPADVFSLDWTRQTHGGGKYNARVKNKLGKYLRSAVFLVDGAPKNGAGPVAAAVPAGDGFSELRDLIRANTDAIKALAARGMSGSADALDTALRIVEVIKPGPGAGYNPAETMKTMMDIFKQGVEIGNTGGGGEDSLVRVVDKIFPPLLDLLTKSVENDRSAKALPGNVTINGTAPDPRKGEPGRDEARAPATSHAGPSLMEQLRTSIGPLKQLARDDREPYTYATVFLDQLSDAHYGELKKFVLSSGDGFCRAVFDAFPDIKEYESWFNEFLSAIAEQTRGDNGQDEQDPAQ